MDRKHAIEESIRKWKGSLAIPYHYTTLRIPLSQASSHLWAQLQGVIFLNLKIFKFKVPAQTRTDFKRSNVAL
jgi:hypothetical protein